MAAQQSYVGACPQSRWRQRCGGQLEHYKIGSGTAAFETEPDGNFALTVQHEPPGNKSNWVPAPDGGFFVALRTYHR